MHKLMLGVHFKNGETDYTEVAPSGLTRSHGRQLSQSKHVAFVVLIQNSQLLALWIYGIGRWPK